MKRFWQNRKGNFALISALAALPLIVALGGAIDAARLYHGKTDLQRAVDAATLALAASLEQDTEVLRALAEKYIAANIDEKVIADVAIASVEATKKTIAVSATGRVDMTFMKLLQMPAVDFKLSAEAERPSDDQVEVSLVLDNTWSMSETDSSGATKIATLKRAAGNLVDKLVTDDNGIVSVGLVPYADYVNVGLSNRQQPWLSVGDDYSVAPAPKVCETKTTKTVCLETAPRYACTRTVDGVSEPATCGGNCTKSEVRTVAPYESCTGGGSATNYRWYGCVGSRMSGTTRLNDGSPNVRYPGYLETSQKCLNPIVPLTKNNAVLKTAINNMIINIGTSYKPYTYIPAGLIWGQNMLSPAAPLTEAATYGVDNVGPRKIMILMTDGENTLQFRSSDGRHVALSTNVPTANSQMDTVNKESASICNYAKGLKIEIFTVAFMVDNAAALNLLKGCATDTQHFFDASDSASLLSAFAGIAGSINAVRLIK